MSLRASIALLFSFLTILAYEYIYHKSYKANGPPPYGIILRPLFSLVKVITTYLLVVMGGTVVFMTFLSVIGYLPYGDRPGPGWYGWQGMAAIKSGLYFLQWASLGVLPGAVAGGLLFVSVQLLRWIDTPRWLIAILGALASGFISLYLVLGVGWYIAIGEVPVYGAGILGLTYGGWLLPKQVMHD